MIIRKIIQKGKILWNKRELPQIYSPCDFTKVLVFSPHPDDDCIGLGGTLNKISKKEVTIVYMTDGSMGHPSIRGKELQKIREKEAYEATEILGIKDLIFLNEEDYALKISKNIVEKTATIIVNKKPEFLFLPFFFDYHKDHKATVEIIGAAIKKLKLEPQCWFYETWQPLIPNKIIDISDTINKKIAAIKAHKSQVESVDYPSKIAGLNSYRSILYSKEMKFAEAFLALTKAEFLKFLREFY